MKMNHIFKATRKLGIVIACVFSLIFMAFSHRVSAAYEPSKAPKIKSFYASADSIPLGQTVMLNWDVINATSIEIKGLEKKSEEVLEPKGSLEVWPEKTTTYILVATGPGGTTSKSITVNVGTTGAAKIDYFKASAGEVVFGNTIELSWKTSNVKALSIIGLEKDKLPEETFPLEGKLEIFPTATTTYILQAIGFKGEVVSKTITVNVIKGTPAKVNTFKASSTKIVEGQSVDLQWDVTNAKTIEIKDVQKNLASKGSVTVKPTTSTTYVLSAVGSDGVLVEKSVTVVVTPAPKPEITSFTASELTVEKGTLVTLKWTTKNAQGCMLLTSDGAKLQNRPANGSISVTPNATKTYTLVAYDKNQVVAEKTITIKVK